MRCDCGQPAHHPLCDPRPPSSNATNEANIKPTLTQTMHPNNHPPLNSPTEWLATPGDTAVQGLRTPAHQAHVRNLT